MQQGAPDTAGPLMRNKLSRRLDSQFAIAQHVPVGVRLEPMNGCPRFDTVIELWRRSMRKLLIGGLLATTMLMPAFGAEMWRSSKLIGLNVYNDQNEKLGDISEILLDKSGKVEGVVIGVGGFLGMGKHDIKVEMGKLKFIDEPVRTASTTGSATTTTTKTTDNRPATTTTTTTKNKWYPDHAVLSGATKDSLKNTPEFKFD
jgi:sporulation protein YlmC with PRC-barrel domain